MKKTFFLMTAMMALLTVSCNNNSEETENKTEGSALVRVHVNEFSISVTEFAEAVTRASENVASYTGVGAMTLAFYNADGTEVYKTTQLKSDNTTFTTFGNFSCSLPIGNYTMVVIGRGHFEGDEFTLTSPTSASYTSERPRETFSYTQSVTVTNTTPLNLSVTLNRVIAQLQINSTDGRSAGVAKIRTTYEKGSKSFSPTTGLAIEDNGFVVTNTPSTAVGNSINVGSFVFLASDEETMNITVEALDASNNVLFTKVVPDVTLKRNRQTTLRGAIFTASSPSSAAFQVETTWLPGTTVNF